MAEQDDVRGSDQGEAGHDEPVPIMQQLLDNPFLLLVLGLAVPTIFYILWGIIEITQIPIAE